MTDPVSPQKALIYTMVTISAADSTMTDSELLKIGEIVQTLPVFREFDADKLVQVAEECGALLEGDDGLDTVLEVIAGALPEKLYKTAYALAVEVAAADLVVEQEELRFLALLRDRLHLDKLTVAAIELSARVRNRVV
ncbi:tellurite resistance protein TerB [Breoghania corrubedonensis]|uniref:Tellurite resistance protein TerB n=1 Tax=Breoghania corrubedonensis TaxID=665038 RepID=A0A2T5VEE2_9HYPH|nr:tellurite resistance TerB family protein [Breoghania corrubedonensis]PTW62128.1 tellurite resistance protein TerB [Breoghania corrubedonensis]